MKLAFALDWLYRTMWLSLLQLWTGLVFSSLIDRPLTWNQVLLDGVLIFFANSVILSIGEECRRRERHVLSQAESEIIINRLTTRYIPRISLWLSVCAYCALLAQRPKLLPLVVAVQIVLLSLAMLYSFWFLFRTRIELEAMEGS